MFESQIQKTSSNQSCLYSASLTRQKPTTAPGNIIFTEFYINTDNEAIFHFFCKRSWHIVHSLFTYKISSYFFTLSEIALHRAQIWGCFHPLTNQRNKWARTSSFYSRNDPLQMTSISHSERADDLLAHSPATRSIIINELWTSLIWLSN